MKKAITMSLEEQKTINDNNQRNFSMVELWKDNMIKRIKKAVIKEEMLANGIYIPYGKVLGDKKYVILVCD